MMGAGMLFLGLGAIATGLVGLLPHSANLSVTVFNISACIGAFLQFAGALTALVGWTFRPAGHRTALTAAVYGATSSSPARSNSSCSRQGCSSCCTGSGTRTSSSGIPSAWQ